MAVSALQYDPTSKVIVSGGADHAVKVWKIDEASGELRPIAARQDAHGGWVPPAVTRLHVKLSASPPQERYAITGSHEALGQWDPRRGVELEWRPGNQNDPGGCWTSKQAVQIPPTKRLEFKFVKMVGDSVEWENGPNRVLEVPAGDRTRLGLRGRYNGDSVVTLEDPATAASSAAQRMSAPGIPGGYGSSRFAFPGRYMGGTAEASMAAQPRRWKRERGAQRGDVSSSCASEAEADAEAEARTQARAEDLLWKRHWEEASCTLAAERGEFEASRENFRLAGTRRAQVAAKILEEIAEAKRETARLTAETARLKASYGTDPATILSSPRPTLSPQSFSRSARGVAAAESPPMRRSLGGRSYERSPRPQYRC
eukprot:TRINITY_DN46379_c0_g1_i1.p1 TRINITY_DN46379_c0_g1~~TRINITY_DN46379_c0_g1_i1.p1  ORF type:complete len:404 (+),score=93.86 TRINITY_DN46379_c0_g1_i1:101-1213(+)